MRVVSAGFSTLVGYAAALPAVYSWGTEVPMPPTTAFGFMFMGELVEIGPSSEIFTSPKDRKTDDYITGRFG